MDATADKAAVSINNTILSLPTKGFRHYVVCIWVLVGFESIRISVRKESILAREIDSGTIRRRGKIELFHSLGYLSID